MTGRKWRDTPEWKYFLLRKKTTFTQVSLFIFGLLSYVTALVVILADGYQTCYFAKKQVLHQLLLAMS